MTRPIGRRPLTAECSWSIRSLLRPGQFGPLWQMRAEWRRWQVPPCGRLGQLENRPEESEFAERGIAFLQPGREVFTHHGLRRQQPALNHAELLHPRGGPAQRRLDVITAAFPRAPDQGCQNAE